jgi:3-hydroxybutyryl-CoA dehydrogenase
MHLMASSHPDWSTAELTVAVVGAGAMGRGIAQVMALAGCRVLLTDARPDAVDDAVGYVRGMIERLVDKGRLDAGLATAASARISGVGPEPAGLAAADLAIEAIVEDLAAKRALFASLEEQVEPTAVLATNTSSLSVTAIAAGLAYPERVCGLHFFNPVPLMKLVEVIPGERTDRDVVDALAALVRRIGHTAVEVRDTPGFLVNHAGRAYSTEALRLLDEGVANPTDIDRILRESAGFRLGPFELFDLTGLDVSQPVMETLYHGFYEDPRLRPSPTGRRRLAGGRLGRKTGEGFYRYGDGGSADVADEPAIPPYDGTPAWVSPEYPDSEGLRASLSAAGVTVATGGRPPEGAIAVVTPWGSDVTTAVVEHGLPGERTLGVDPFGGYAGRLTLATNPATSADALSSAYCALATTGHPVTVIRDSPGFVAQRVVACIVNLACDIAQQGLAAPGDIDRAVEFALGYPQGPLAWGDAVGPATVLRIVEGLFEAYRDPRYRPSIWLSRRARLGMSLLAEERRPARP